MRKIKKISPGGIGILLALFSAMCSSIYDPLGSLISNESFSLYFFGAFAYFGGLLVALISFFLILIKNRESKDHNFLKGKKEWGIAFLSALFSVGANLLLLLALKIAPASQVALFSNVEIVCTSLLAFLFFKEAIEWFNWTGIALIFSGVIILSLSSSTSGAISFSPASLLALGAAFCWGMENNLTRLISHRNSAQTIIIKCSIGSILEFIIAFSLGGSLTNVAQPFEAIGVGIIAFGISLLCYIHAQRRIGASKTSAFYASSPFLGSIISLLIYHEVPSWAFYLAFCLILCGQAFIAFFTLKKERNKEKASVSN